MSNLSFYSNNNNTTTGFRFVIRLDNNTPGNTADDFWVATSTLFDSTTGGNSTNWVTNSALESFAFTSAAAAWNELNFTPGSTLALGAVRSSVIPDSGISAFGLFTSEGTVRFDNFSIATVSEPSSLLLLVSAAAPFLVRRSRRTCSKE